jgi:hypothetical protein
MEFVVEDELAPWSGRWPDPDEGPWQVTLSWAWVQDRAECVAFTLAPVQDAEVEPISATLLRKVPVMRLVTQARRKRFERAGGSLLEALDDGQDLDVGAGLEASLRAQAAGWEQRRPGRPATLNREHYGKVAGVYSSARVAGQPPLVAVQRRWQVARPTASRWIAAARELNLLPATERGRARGNGETTSTGQVEP